MLHLLLLMLSATASFAAEERPQDTSVPFSRLFSLTVRDIFAPSQWHSDQHANTVEFRPLVPFYIGDQLNIARITVPYRTSWPTGSGLGDVRVFDLLAFPSPPILWSIGPVVNLRANLPPGTDTIQGGVVLGAIAFSGRWAFGLLNQNIFSGTVTASTFQPVLIYQPNDHWTFGFGELPFVINWRTVSPVFVPLGFQVGFQPSNHAPRIFVNPQYNTKQVTSAPQWTITTGVTLPVSYPRKGAEN